MTYPSVVTLPGGFADHPPGLASLAALLVRLLAAKSAPHCRVVVGPHTVHVHAGGDLGPVWEATARPDERVVASLGRALTSSARTALADPVERMCDGLERAAWGDSHWRRYWGDPPEVAADRLGALLADWAAGATPAKVEDDAFVIRRGPASPWAAGTAVAPADGARVLVGLAVPVRGEHAVGRAAVAAAVLGTPTMGRLAARLRHRDGLCYGSMAWPLVRGEQVALVAAVSTTAPRAAQCARRLAAETRALAAERLDPREWTGWADRVRLARTVALARLRDGLDVDALGRCWLEVPAGSGAGVPEGAGGADLPGAVARADLPGTAGHAGLPEGAEAAPRTLLDIAGGPAWFLHGPVPESLPDLTEEIW